MSLQDENNQILALNQAMIGSITPNLRRVTLESLGPQSVRFHFLLEHDDPVDREEIGHVLCEFKALQEHSFEVESTIQCDTRPLVECDIPGRIAYGRWEGA